MGGDKKNKRSDRFKTPAAGIIITRPDGTSVRGDGKPLTDSDRAWIAGIDPLAEQLKQIHEDEIEARKLLGFWLRQGDGGMIPAKVPMTPVLAKLVDEVTAQEIWDELLAAQRQALGDMSLEALEELTREIMSQGIDEKTALHYAALIGDLPLTDETGSCIIVREHGQEIARLKPLKFFDMK